MMHFFFVPALSLQDDLLFNANDDALRHHLRTDRFAFLPLSHCHATWILPFFLPFNDHLALLISFYTLYGHIRRDDATISTSW
jgi:hypothetical protein